MNLWEDIYGTITRTVEETFKKSFSRYVNALRDPQLVPKRKLHKDGWFRVTQRSLAGSGWAMGWG